MVTILRQLEIFIEKVAKIIDLWHDYKNIQVDADFSYKDPKLNVRLLVIACSESFSNSK
jgi:hypothetical protein